MEIPRRLRILQPCDRTWSSLEGGGSVRYCSECRLDVHDFARLSVAQAERLLKSGTRVCGMLPREAPTRVSLAHEPPRLSRRTILRALAAIAGLGAVAQGSRAASGAKDDCKQLLRRRAPGTASSVRVTVTDELGYPIPDARVALKRQETEHDVRLPTDTEGRAAFADVARGTYDLDVLAAGFMARFFVDLKVRSHEAIEIRVDLQPGRLGEVVALDAKELEKCSE